VAGVIRKVLNKVLVPASDLCDFSKQSRQFRDRQTDEERLNKSAKYPDWANQVDLAGQVVL
jgi:hypothetical protein